MRWNTGGLLTLLASLAFGAQAFAQEPRSDPDELEDVVVIGTPLEREAQAFVDSVSAPVGARKLAKWSGGVCVGVAGIERAHAQSMADRVSDWAHSLGVTVAEPGCSPNIFIVMTADGAATAQAMVASRPREFRTGVSGANRSAQALEGFRTSTDPVRWWHVSLPVDEAGDPVVRLRGQPPCCPKGVITRPADLGDWAQPTFSSRLLDETRDDLQQVIIVVDIGALETATYSQIIEYVSMVAMAQIEPGVSPNVPSILSLFDPAKAQVQTLTAWDISYLRALYSAPQMSKFAGGNAASVAQSLVRDLRRERSAETSSEP